MPALHHIKHRDNLGAWLNANGLTGHMAEIGCAFGGFARQNLANWKGQDYVMVDPWEKQPAEVYKENTNDVNYDGWFFDCQKLAASDDRVKLVRKYSVDAAPDFPDGYFDAVYIDGNHSYEAVEQDLNAWWPKVRLGGVLCGHDYYNATTDGHFCQVMNAVNTWATVNKLSYLVTPCSSWWIEK